MAVAEEVRTMFAGHRFGIPCTESDIHRAEDARRRAGADGSQQRQ